MKNNTHFFFVISLVVISQSLQAQCYSMSKGTNRQYLKKYQIQLKGGVGLLPTFFMDNTKTIQHPTTFGIDFFLSKNLSFGLFRGMSIQETKKFYPQISSTLQLKNEHEVMGGRILLHLAKRSRWNVYGGFGVSRHLSKIEVTSDQDPLSIYLISTIQNQLRIFPKESSYVYSGIVGGQYFFTNRLSVFGELGNNISLVTSGITYSINM